MAPQTKKLTSPLFLRTLNLSAFLYSVEPRTHFLDINAAHLTPAISFNIEMGRIEIRAYKLSTLFFLRHRIRHGPFIAPPRNFCYLEPHI